MTIYIDFNRAMPVYISETLALYSELSDLDTPGTSCFRFLSPAVLLFFCLVTECSTMVILTRISFLKYYAPLMGIEGHYSASRLNTPKQRRAVYVLGKLPWKEAVQSMDGR